MNSLLDPCGDNQLVKSETKVGSDMMTLSHKVTNESFNAYKWHPDPLVYVGVLAACETKYMDDDEERLYIDLLWLALQVTPKQLACSNSTRRPAQRACGALAPRATARHAAPDTDCVTCSARDRTGGRGAVHG